MSEAASWLDYKSTVIPIYKKNKTSTALAESQFSCKSELGALVKIKESILDK